jgi:predicted component of type VI protein secretion system
MHLLPQGVNLNFQQIMQIMNLLNSLHNLQGEVTSIPQDIINALNSTAGLFSGSLANLTSILQHEATNGKRLDAKIDLSSLMHLLPQGVNLNFQQIMQIMNLLNSLHNLQGEVTSIPQDIINALNSTAGLFSGSLANLTSILQHEATNGKRLDAKIDLSSLMHLLPQGVNLNFQQIMQIMNLLNSLHNLQGEVTSIPQDIINALNSTAGLFSGSLANLTSILQHEATNGKRLDAKIDLSSLMHLLPQGVNLNFQQIMQIMNLLNSLHNLQGEVTSIPQDIINALNSTAGLFSGSLANLTSILQHEATNGKRLDAKIDLSSLMHLLPQGVNLNFQQIMQIMNLLNSLHNLQGEVTSIPQDIINALNSTAGLFSGSLANLTSILQHEATNGKRLDAKIDLSSLMHLLPQGVNLNFQQIMQIMNLLNSLHNLQGEVTSIPQDIINALNSTAGLFSGSLANLTSILQHEATNGKRLDAKIDLSSLMHLLPQGVNLNFQQIMQIMNLLNSLHNLQGEVTSIPQDIINALNSTAGLFSGSLANLTSILQHEATNGKRLDAKIDLSSLMHLLPQGVNLNFQQIMQIMNLLNSLHNLQGEVTSIPQDIINALNSTAGLFSGSLANLTSILQHEATNGKRLDAKIDLSSLMHLLPQGVNLNFQQIMQIMNLLNSLHNLQGEVTSIPQDIINALNSTAGLFSGSLANLTSILQHEATNGKRLDAKIDLSSLMHLLPQGVNLNFQQIMQIMNLLNSLHNLQGEVTSIPQDIINALNSTAGLFSGSLANLTSILQHEATNGKRLDAKIDLSSLMHLLPQGVNLNFQQIMQIMNLLNSLHNLQGEVTSIPQDIINALNSTAGLFSGSLANLTSILQHEATNGKRLDAKIDLSSLMHLLPQGVNLNFQQIMQIMNLLNSLHNLQGEVTSIPQDIINALNSTAGLFSGSLANLTSILQHEATNGKRLDAKIDLSSLMHLLPQGVNLNFQQIMQIMNLLNSLHNLQGEVTSIPQDIINALNSTAGLFSGSLANLTSILQHEATNGKRLDAKIDLSSLMHLLPQGVNLNFQQIMQIMNLLNSLHNLQGEVTSIPQDIINALNSTAGLFSGSLANLTSILQHEATNGKRLDAKIDLSSLMHLLPQGVNLNFQQIMQIMNLLNSLHNLQGEVTSIPQDIINALNSTAGLFSGSLANLTSILQHEATNGKRLDAKIDLSSLMHLLPQGVNLNFQQIMQIMNLLNSLHNLQGEVTSIPQDIINALNSTAGLFSGSLANLTSILQHEATNGKRLDAKIDLSSLMHLLPQGVNLNFQQIMQIMNLLNSLHNLQGEVTSIPQDIINALNSTAGLFSGSLANLTSILQHEATNGKRLDAKIDLSSLMHLLPQGVNLNFQQIMQIMNLLNSLHNLQGEVTSIPQDIINALNSTAGLFSGSLANLTSILQHEATNGKRLDAKIDLSSLMHLLPQGVNLNFQQIMQIMNLLNSLHNLQGEVTSIPQDIINALNSTAGLFSGSLANLTSILQHEATNGKRLDAKIDLSSLMHLLPQGVNLNFQQIMQIMNLLNSLHNLQGEVTSIPQDIINALNSTAGLFSGSLANLTSILQHEATNGKRLDAKIDLSSLMHLLPQGVNLNFQQIMQIMNLLNSLHNLQGEVTSIPQDIINALNSTAGLFSGSLANLTSILQHEATNGKRLDAKIDLSSLMHLLPQGVNLNFQQIMQIMNLLNSLHNLQGEVTSIPQDIINALNSTAGLFSGSLANLTSILQHEATNGKRLMTNLY